MLLSKESSSKAQYEHWALRTLYAFDVVPLKSEWALIIENYHKLMVPKKAKNKKLLRAEQYSQKIKWIPLCKIRASILIPSTLQSFTIIRVKITKSAHKLILIVIKWKYGKHIAGARAQWICLPFSPFLVVRCCFFFLLSFLFHSLLQCCLSVDINSVCLFCMVRIDMDTCIACDWNWVSARFVVIRILCRHNRSLARCRRNTIRFIFGINRNSCACVLVLV